MQRYKI